MPESVTILQDLSLVLAFSGMFALLFHYLRLPLLLGYMVGGFLIGPHCFSSWVYGADSIEQLSELGVIFLMFYIGLEFDLLKLRKIFVPSAFWLTLQTIGMMILGNLIAPLLGWSGLNGIFLGSMLVMSSTMITVPLLKAKNALNTEYAQCAVGCLILEDILAVIFLVILSSIAKTGQFDITQVRQSAFIIGVFVVMVFCIGKLIAPFFVRAIFRSASKEVLAVAVIGFMMTICLLAHYFQLSVALGAFLAGSILAQTHLAEEIDKITEPLRDVFNAVFFTTIGLMIDLKAILHLWPWIVLLATLTFVGQTSIGTISLFLVGKKPEVAFKAAFSKAQIGEFSFVIATLGNSLGVLHKDFISVTVGVALGTILLCSLLEKKMNSIYTFFSSKTPRFLSECCTAYTNLIAEIKDNASKNGFLRLIFKQLLATILWIFLLSGTLYLVSKLAIITRSGEFGKMISRGLIAMQELLCKLSPSCAHQIASQNNVFEMSTNLLQLIIWSCAFLLCIPFLAGVVKNVYHIFVALINDTLGRRMQSALAKNKVLDVIHAMLVVAAIFLFSGIFLGIAARYLPGGVPIALFGTIAIILGVMSWKNLSLLNNRIELAFIKSFNDKIETSDQINRRSILARAAKDTPWSIILHEVVLKPNHDIIGKQLSDIQLRERTGTNIIAITRGGVSTYRITPDTQFFPNDSIILLGTQQQINNAKQILLAENTVADAPRHKNAQFDMLSFCIGNDQNFTGHLLSDLHLRQKFGINVIGIQRDNEQMTEIKPNIELRNNDILLLAGTKYAIADFQSAFVAKGNNNSTTD